jgi:hypothetical protein
MRHRAKGRRGVWGRNEEDACVVTGADCLLHAARTDTSVCGSGLPDYGSQHCSWHSGAIQQERVCSPKILDPITGKGFLIGPFSRDEAEKLADSINHRAVCYS